VKNTISDKKYEVIYADPAWQYNTKSPLASKRPETCQRAGGVDYYYPTMPLDEIKQLPINELSEKDAILFLWATVPLLPEAFEVISAWGYKYKTMITWHKLRCKGMGYWFRGHTEHLLLATKGKISPFRSLQHNIISHPVQKHSEKPDVFRKLIEKETANYPRRIELFARSRFEGWDSWGNQLPTDKQIYLEQE
jgi:N6-adenosine-specific RNA methylase IME4